MRRDSLTDILNELLRGIQDTNNRLNQVNGSIVEIKAELNSLKGNVREAVRDLKDRVSDAEKTILNNLIDKLKQFEDKIEKNMDKLDGTILNNQKTVMDTLKAMKTVIEDIQTIVIESQNNIIEKIENGLNYEATHLLFLDMADKRIVDKDELRLGREYTILIKLRGHEKTIKMVFNGEIEDYLDKKTLTGNVDSGDREGNYLKLKISTRVPEREPIMKRLLGRRIDGYYKLFIDDHQIEISPVAVKKTKINILTGVLGTIIAAIISISGIVFKLFDNLIYSLFGISTITVYFLALIYLVEAFRK